MTDNPEGGTPLPNYDDFVKQHTGKPTFEDLTKAIEDTAEDLGQIYSFPTVNTPTPPSVILDASGVPHAVIPLTKKTKAIIGTLAGTVSTLGTSSALLFLPDNVRLWAAGAAFVAGGILTWIGIVHPTNLPVRSDKV